MPRRSIFLFLMLLAGCDRDLPVRQVLVISIDTLRPDYLGAYEPAADWTPNVDRFAAESALFEDALAQGPSTAISHKSIFYSLYPPIHKTAVRSVPREDIVAPVEALRSSGFRTGAFVGGGQLDPRYNIDSGFETYVVAERGERRPLLLLRRRAVAWLEENGSGPFFLFLHTYQVHGPYNPPEPYRSKHAGWYGGDIDPARRGWRKLYDRRDLTSEEVRLIRSLYAASVEYVDAFLGELFAALQEMDLYDGTLIVLLSDHGQQLGEDGIWGHGKLLERQLRIPLILRIPGLDPVRVASPVEAVDVMPTIFALTGVEPPYRFQGVNLLPALRGEAPWPEERIRFAQKGRLASVRSARWKLLFDVDGEFRPSILTLEGVEESLRRRAGRPPEEVLRLRRAYDRMLEEAAGLDARFVLDADSDPTRNTRVRERLEALGYLR